MQLDGEFSGENEVRKRRKSKRRMTAQWWDVMGPEVVANQRKLHYYKMQRFTAAQLNTCKAYKYISISRVLTHKYMNKYLCIDMANVYVCHRNSLKAGRLATGKVINYHKYLKASASNGFSHVSLRLSAVSSALSRLSPFKIRVRYHGPVLSYRISEFLHQLV